MDLYFIAPDAGGNSILVVYEFFSAGVAVDYSFIILVPTAGQTFEDLRQVAIASATSYASAHSYTVTNIARYYPDIATSTVEGIMSSTDKVKLDALISTVRTTSSLSLSLVGTGATGTQIHATKDSTVRAIVSLSSTSILLGSASSTATLKKCATNDSTEGNWTSASIASSGASGVAATVTDTRQVTTDVPAGWYVKLVASGTNTHSESFVSAEKTIYG